jgi:RNA polymerase sigma-70 factor (ECF subfamily)
MNEITLCEHLDALYGYAMWLTGNSFDAADLAQETCLRALEASHRLRPNSNIKSWLFTILRHAWLNQLRRVRNAKTVNLAEYRDIAEIVVDTSNDPCANYLAKIEIRSVRSAIQRLPDHLKEVIILRVVQ